MATREERSGSSVTTAAEIVGRAAGQAAGAVDTFRSRHPHPISEVGEALKAGQEALTDLAAQARAGSAAVVAKTMDAAERAQTIVRRARRRAVKTLARAKRATRKAVTHTKKVARKRSPSAAARKRTTQTSTAAASTPVSRKKRRPKRSKATNPARPNAGTRRRLQNAHVKRRQAHTASRVRRKQARRDKRR
jgi:hypothetical protein